MKKTLQQIINERHELVGLMTDALARPDMKKFYKLNVKYQKLSDKIKKKRGKNGISEKGVGNNSDNGSGSL